MFQFLSEIHSCYMKLQRFVFFFFHYTSLCSWAVRTISTSKHWTMFFNIYDFFIHFVFYSFLRSGTVAFSLSFPFFPSFHFFPSMFVDGVSFHLLFFPSIPLACDTFPQYHTASLTNLFPIFDARVGFPSSFCAPPHTHIHARSRASFPRTF